MTNFRIGDEVTKIDGYRWPGVVRSVFTNEAGADRVVVECTVPEVKGALHIFAADQIKLVKEPDASRAFLVFHLAEGELDALDIQSWKSVTTLKPGEATTVPAPRDIGFFTRVTLFNYERKPMLSVHMDFPSKLCVGASYTVRLSSG